MRSFGSRYSPPQDSTFLCVPSNEEGPAPVIGKTLAHYKIVEKIGEGGMGEVYLARGTSSFDAEVAIKLISPKLLAADPDSTWRASNARKPPPSPRSVIRTS